MVGRSSQVARGLNTIAANIVANRDALKNFGIEVETSSGELRSTYDVLSDLSKIWDKLDDTTKVTLGTMLAGKNQYKVLASVMSNFATTTNATATALDSAGSAAKENERYMESIEARVTAVSAAFQKMSTAVVDSDIAKGILDIVKASAEFGSTGVGSAITQILLLSGVSWGGLQLLGQSILPGIINSFKLLSGVSLSVLSAQTGISESAIALGASLPYILGVTAAIVGLVSVIKTIKSAYDEANPSVEEAFIKLEQSKTEYQSVEESYQKAKTKLDELNSTPYEARTPEIQEEIDKLKDLITYYENLKTIREEEQKYAASVYVSAVEREGISTGVSVSGIVKTGKKTEEGIAEVREFSGVYKDLESAIIAAASASAQFNGQVVTDISDVSLSMKELQIWGFSFEEQFIDLGQELSSFSNYLNILTTTFDAENDSLDYTTQRYERLIELGSEYADSLKLLDYETLTDSQKEFLSQWDSMISTYESLSEAVEDFGDSSESAVDKQIASWLEAAGALGEYAQNLLAAKTAYEQFKQSMEQSGDYDDSFKGLVSVFNELNGEWEKGQVGSKAFLTALELLTGQTFDSSSATDYLSSNLEILNLLFGDSESGGVGLIAAMQKLNEQGKLTGATITDVGDGIEISVDSFSDLANSLGISESVLYSLTQALKVLGINFNYSVDGADDMLNKMRELGEGIVDTDESTGKSTVNFEKFVEQAKAAGMSTEEILQIAEVMQDASNVDLQNLDAGLALLGTNSEDGADAANDLASGLEDVAGTASGISDTAASASDLAGSLGQAASSSTTLYANLSAISGIKFPSLFGNAKGTNYAQEGDSLVNEEGPEIIQSGDRAYIAGGGMPTITHLHRGDKVFTADETEDILNGKTIDSIQAHAGGSKVSKSSVGISGGTATISKQTLENAWNKSVTQSSKSSSGGGSSKSSSDSAAKTAKDEFDEWLKAKKHALAMDEITEKEYYEELEKMNEKYFKDSEEYQDEYWKYQEEVYKWRKSQLEEENKLLEKQIDLEKALGELAKAKEQKILVYKDGRFQYVQDIDAINEAQRTVAQLQSELGYASGTTSASSGIHLVGENGPELRVLNSGDGIIPADATKNLLGLAQMNTSKLAGNLGKAMQVLYSFNIDNLSLPDVKDAAGFFEGLKNYAYQYSYAQ